MKKSTMKKLTCGLVAAALLLAPLAPATAEDAASKNAAGPAATGAAIEMPPVVMNFSGKPINLTLDEALKRILSEGPGFDAAALGRDLLKTASTSAAESWQQLNTMSKMLDDLARLESVNPAYAGASRAATAQGVPSLNGPTAQLIQLTRDYYASQSAISYKMSLDNLERSTIQMYYLTLQAQENLRIAKDNLRIQNEILENTKKKLDLGLAAKMDVLLAESAVQDAQSKADAAETAYSSARMGFNIQLNYPLMQDVRLTDSLTRITPPSIAMGEAIKSALANRNEIRSAEFNVKKSELDRDSVSSYPLHSATYLDKALAFTQAQMTLDNAKLTIEMDIRNRYMNLSNLTSAITGLEMTVKNAQEGYRLASISYDAGVQTLVDVQTAQNASYLAQLGLAAKILEYNLAVYDLGYYTGYGLPATQGGA